jgi:hypothetical protein
MPSTSPRFRRRGDTDDAAFEFMGAVDEPPPQLGVCAADVSVKLTVIQHYLSEMSAGKEPGDGLGNYVRHFES